MSNSPNHSYTRLSNNDVEQPNSGDLTSNILKNTVAEDDNTSLSTESTIPNQNNSEDTSNSEQKEIEKSEEEIKEFEISRAPKIDEKVEIIKVKIIRKPVDPIDLSQVYIDAKIKNISNINLPNESFDVRMHMYVVYHLDATKKQLKRTDTGDIEPTTYPELEIENLAKKNEITFGQLSNGKQFSIREVIDTDSKHYYSIRFKLELDVTCSEEFELQNFPFDCQDLSIHFRLSKVGEQLSPSIKAKRDNKAFISIDKTYMCLKEYELNDAIAEFYRGSGSESKSGRQYSYFTLRLKLKRKHTYYVWNYFLLMGCLSLCSFISFVINGNDNLGDKFAVLLSLILAFIAEQFVVSNNLPNLSYLTILDKYLIGNFIFVILITVVSFFVSIDAQFYEKGNSNFIFAISSFGVWVMCQLFTIYYCWEQRKKERKKLRMNSKGLSDLFDTESTIAYCELAYKFIIWILIVIVTSFYKIFKSFCDCLTCKKNSSKRKPKSKHIGIYNPAKPHSIQWEKYDGDAETTVHLYVYKGKSSLKHNHNSQNRSA